MTSASCARKRLRTKNAQGGGGKKGGGGSSGGGLTEDDNTLQSDATHVLGEGPIAGLWLGTRSIYLNNVLLLNITTGAPNFFGIATDFRAGYPRPGLFRGDGHD